MDLWTALALSTCTAAGCVTECFCRVWIGHKIWKSLGCVYSPCTRSVCVCDWAFPPLFFQSSFEVWLLVTALQTCLCLRLVWLRLNVSFACTCNIFFSGFYFLAMTKQPTETPNRHNGFGIFPTCEVSVSVQSQRLRHDNNWCSIQFVRAARPLASYTPLLLNSRLSPTPTLLSEPRWQDILFIFILRVPYNSHYLKKGDIWQQRSCTICSSVTEPVGLLLPVELLRVLTRMKITLLPTLPASPPYKS